MKLLRFRSSEFFEFGKQFVVVSFDFVQIGQEFGDIRAGEALSNVVHLVFHV